MLTLSNDMVSCSVTLNGDRIENDRLTVLLPWARRNNAPVVEVTSDAGFSLECIWSGPFPSGMAGDDGGFVRFQKRDFSVVGFAFREQPDGSAMLRVDCRHGQSGVLLRVEYMLEPEAFYCRRRILVSDSSGCGHFLQSVAPLDAALLGKWKILKAGGLGQPAVLQSLDGGAFFGLEYPAASVSVTVSPQGSTVRCAQECGEQIRGAWLVSDWAVIAVVPDYAIRPWFFEYCKRLRPSKAKQSLVLDLSHRLLPRETGVANSTVLEEGNTLETVRQAARSLAAREASLDAVLLGPGWDIVESEWQIDGGAFPRGFTPIGESLRPSGVLGLRLGIFRDSSRGGLRMPWLARRGYEVASSCPEARTMCLAGENYGRLVLQRCRELAEQGTGLFFLEPVETICNETGHGHAPGAFSRYAVVRALERIVSGVRAKRADAVFALGEGVWLSPWWLTFVDYLAPFGVTPMDSVSPAPLLFWTRISAIDKALFESSRVKNFWFPMRNGITEPIGVDCPDSAVAAQPIEAFADAVITELCRGTSLHILGLTPSALDTSRWNFLAQAMRWAADRAGLFSRTEMIGGDPARDDCYGYVHAEGTRAVVLARNPGSNAANLRLSLAHSLGLDPSGKDLVIERVYPNSWVAPRVYQAGETIGIPLKAWETAVYEIYPLTEARKPLIAGVPFSAVYEGEQRWKVTLYDRARNMTLLNPSRVRSVRLSAEEIDFPTAFLRTARTPSPLQKGTERLDRTDVPGRLALEAVLDPSVDSAALYVLLSPVDARQPCPSLAFATRGSVRPLRRIEARAGKVWFILPGMERSILGELVLQCPGREGSWTGQVEVWVRCVQKMSPTTLHIEADFSGQDKPMPPSQAPEGIGIVYAPVGVLDVRVK